MKRYLIFVSVGILFYSCVGTSRPTHDKSTYFKYRFSSSDTIVIPKLHPSDDLWFVRQMDNGLIGYCSRGSDKLGFFDPSSNKTYSYEVIEGEGSCGNVGMTIYNDSNVLVHYFGEHNESYIDNSIFLINVFTGERKFIVMEKADKSFLRKDDVSLDSLEKNFNFLTSSKRKLRGSEAYIAENNVVYTTIQTGGNSKLYGSYVVDGEGIARIELESGKTSYPGIIFSKMNPRFTDTLPKFFSFRYFIPNLFPIDVVRFGVNYSSSADMYVYNSANNTHLKVSGFPKFIQHQEFMDLNFETKSSEDMYEYKMFSNVKSKFAVRLLQIPFSKSNQRISKYIVHSKDSTCQPIGIIEEDIIGRLLSVNQFDELLILDELRSASDNNNFYIVKHRLEVISEENDMYAIDTNNMGSKNIENYLSQLSKDLTTHDTIPVFFTYNICPLCIEKLGSFLGKVESQNDKVRPMVLVSRNKFVKVEYYLKYGISNVVGVFNDKANRFTQFMTHPNSASYLIKSDGKYILVPVPIDDLDKMFKFLNPKYKVIDGICVPIKPI